MICSNAVAGYAQSAKGRAYFKDKRFSGRGQLRTSSIALEGALVEMVASSQHSLQEVDEALAGTHLLAPHLQHLQLLPHLPPQQSAVSHAFKTSTTPYQRQGPAAATQLAMQPEMPEGLLGQSDAEGDSLLQCGAYLATQNRKPNSFVPVLKTGYIVW